MAAHMTPRPIRLIRTWRRRAATRIGRRGAFLLFLTVVDATFAWSLASPTDEARRSPTTAYIASIAPLPAWSALWAVVAVVCLIGAVRHHDRIAFAAAAFLKVLFGLTLLGAQLVAHINQAFLGGVIWLFFALVVYLISTWPEAPSPGPAP
jgi:hypothetical protein